MTSIEKSTFLGTYPDMRSLFHSLDAPFLKFDKNHVDPIIWHAKDFNIQTKHEVRVPAVAGSTVKYCFSTTNGDISFGLHYATPGNLVEVIREVMREPSDIEPIQGSYKADYDGIFIFVFDNSFSWFTDKLITYDITLLQVGLCQQLLSYVLSLVLYSQHLQWRTVRVQFNVVGCSLRWVKIRGKLK